MFLWSLLNLCVANCTTDVSFHIDFLLHTLQVLGQSKEEVCNFSIHFPKVRTTEFMTGFCSCNNSCAISIWWETIPPMNHDCKKFLFLQQPYFLAGTQSSTKSSYVFCYTTLQQLQNGRSSRSWYPQEQENMWDLETDATHVVFGQWQSKLKM